MNKKPVFEKHPFACAACHAFRRLLEPGCEKQGKCEPLETRPCFLETPLDITKVPQLSDYTELIW